MNSYESEKIPRVESGRSLYRCVNNFSRFVTWEFTVVALNENGRRRERRRLCKVLKRISFSSLLGSALGGGGEEMRRWRRGRKVKEDP